MDSSESYLIIQYETPQLLGVHNFSVEPSLIISPTRTSIFGFFGGLLDLFDPLEVGMFDGLLQQNCQDHPYMIEHVTLNYLKTFEQKLH